MVGLDHNVENKVALHIIDEIDFATFELGALCVIHRQVKV